MTLSVPSCAACRVRAIGASAHEAPFAVSCLANSRVWLTEEVPRSTITCPARMFFRMPSPSNTARTCFALGRHRNTRSLCFSTSATAAATSATSLRRRASGSAERSNASTRRPLFSKRLRQIGSPITPRPMKPMVLWSVICTSSFCLTRFLHANRYPLRLKTLCFYERARRRKMQRIGVDLVAGARIDFGHDRVMAGNEAVGMPREPLDDFPARCHVADIVDDRKRAPFLQVRIVMRRVRRQYHGTARGLHPHHLQPVGMAADA